MLSPILVVLVFVPVFLVNLQHLKFRHIPLYSWGTVIAIIHLSAGVLWVGLIPIAALIISAVIEITYHMMSEDQRSVMTEQFVEEEEAAERRVEVAQGLYDQLHLVCSFTVEREYQYRRALSTLEHQGIWYHVRNGLITSIFVKPEDAEQAESALGIVPAQIESGDAPDQDHVAGGSA